MNRWRWIGILITGIVLTTTGCATAEPTPTLTPTPDATPTITPTPPPAPVSASRALAFTRAGDPAQQAYVRLVHAAANAPAFDVYIEGLSVANNLSFTQNTEPMGIVAGDYTLRVMPTGVRLDEAEPIFQTPLTLNGQQSSILALSGTPEALSLSTFVESSHPLNSDQSRIAFINLIPGLDVTIQHNGADITPTFPFGQVSNLVVLPTGEAVFNVLGGGIALASHNVTLRGRVSYTVLLVGNSDNVRVIETRQNVAGLVNVRAINGLSSGQAVDVYLDEIPLANSLEFGRTHDWKAMVADIYTVSVYAVGRIDDTTPLARVEINPAADESISLVIVGTKNDVRVVSFREDMSPTAPDQARVVFLNALSTAPRVRVETQAGALENVGDLNFGQPPQTSRLPASTYTFFWNIVQNGIVGEQVEIAENLQFEAGRTYLYLMTGRLGQPPLILSTSVGTSHEAATIASGAASAQVRFVNALRDGLAFAVDGNVVTALLNYGDGSGLVGVTEGDHTLEITQDGVSLASLELAFEPGNSYSIFAYGDMADSALLMAVPDTGLTPQGSSSVRLVNLTAGADARFGLASFRLSEPGRHTSRLLTAPATETFRQSVQIGVQEVVGVDIGNQSFSTALPAPSGAHAIYILDNLQGSVAASIDELNLEVGHHYDIVVDQRPDSPRVDGFVIPYP